MCLNVCCSRCQDLKILTGSSDSTVHVELQGLQPSHNSCTGSRCFAKQFGKWAVYHDRGSHNNESFCDWSTVAAGLSDHTCASGRAALQTMQFKVAKLRLTGQYSSVFLRCCADTNTGTQLPPNPAVRTLSSPCINSICILEYKQQDICCSVGQLKQG